MELACEKETKKPSVPSLLIRNVPPSVNQALEEELKHISKGDEGSPQKYLRLYYYMLRSHDILETKRTKEETLKAAINLVKKDHPKFKPEFNREFFDIPESRDEEAEKDPFLNEILLKAEKLRKKRLKRSVVLSILKAGSFLMLFLALGLVQVDFSLYLFATVLGCVILGISTLLERGT